MLSGEEREAKVRGKGAEERREAKVQGKGAEER